MLTYELIIRTSYVTISSYVNTLQPQQVRISDLLLYIHTQAPSTASREFVVVLGCLKLSTLKHLLQLHACNQSSTCPTSIS